MSWVAFRVSWATRAPGFSIIAAALLGLGLGLGAAIGIFTEAQAGVVWAATFVTAGLILCDFPGPGHARWSELELSLPIAARDLVRARLLLSLGCWMLPLLLALGVLRLAVGLPPADAGRLGLCAAVGVSVACAWRHAFRLNAAGAMPGAARLAGVVPVAVGFLWPSEPALLFLLAAALVLFGIAHVRSAAPLEMVGANRSVEGAPRPGRVERRRATFDRLALRHALGSLQGALWLSGLFAFGFLINTGLSRPVLVMAILPIEFVVFFAVHVTRLLQLSHLPFRRERLFRLVAWPPLIALLLGAVLGTRLASDDVSATIDRAPHRTNTAGKLAVPQRHWRLTSGEVPLVTAPSGESYRPLAHHLGVGSWVVAYNPYEVGRDCSDAFLAHQVARFVREQHGVDLNPLQAEALVVSGPVEHSLSERYYPELHDPVQGREWLVGDAVLLVSVLAALRLPLRPGPSKRSRRWRRPSLTRAEAVFLWVAAIVWVGAMLAYLFSGLDVDVARIVVGPIVHGLAAQVWLVLPVALALAIVSYRHALQRFLHMEPPQRSAAYDAGFIEI